MALYAYKKKKPKVVSPRSKKSTFVPAVLFLTGLTIIGYIVYPYISFFTAQYFKVDNISKEFISPQDSFTAYAQTATPNSSLVSNQDYDKNAAANIAKTSEEIKANAADYQSLANEKGTMYITIDQIGLKNVPVTINANSDSESDYDPILNHSIAHFKGTSLPGIAGKTFLYGHSSRKLPGGSAFSSIFTDLDKLNLGDEFTVTWKDKVYKYSVYKVKLVDRDDFSIIKGDTRKSIDLMTCAPVGVGLKRLIVEAFQEGN